MQTELKKSARVNAICMNPRILGKIVNREISKGRAMHKTLRQAAYILFLLTGLCLTVGSHHPAGAATASGGSGGSVAIAPSPCDPKYYESLKSRAWLEAQREITQNQNLIFKPDSVLEYTCFDKYMSALDLYAKQMFSESDRWGSVLPDTSMGDALNKVVGFALNEYISRNFIHGFLGQRIDDDYFPERVSNANYSCAIMGFVWQKAKCMNFIQNPAEDGFFTFDEYMKSPDKRFLPTRCTPPITSRWRDNIRIAYVNEFTPWVEDDVKTLLEAFAPDNCMDEEHVVPLPTGIVVERGKQAPYTYKEKVCLPPGCHYVPTGMDTGRCEKVLP